MFSGVVDRVRQVMKLKRTKEIKYYDPFADMCAAMGVDPKTYIPKVNRKSNEWCDRYGHYLVDRYKWKVEVTGFVYFPFAGYIPVATKPKWVRAGKQCRRCGVKI